MKVGDEVYFVDAYEKAYQRFPTFFIWKAKIMRGDRNTRYLKAQILPSYQPPYYKPGTTIVKDYEPKFCVNIKDEHSLKKAEELRKKLINKTVKEKYNDIDTIKSLLSKNYIEY